MKILFYVKLALVNIKKNMKFYLPYLATASFTVMMYYMFCFLVNNQGIEAMGPSTAAGLRSIFGFGKVVIAVFAIIFLFYTNSFVIKRRKKELGVYNVLGMEKRHLAFVILLESIFIGIVSIVVGLGLGILFSKLMLLLLFNIIKLEAGFGFEISMEGIKYSVGLFGLVFAVNLVYNLLQIALTKPINLLTGGNVGEKEPKTKWILTIVGCACMIAGYVLANTIKSPLKAIPVFFLAVMLVIAGTYLLFITVSITILKMLKKSKHFYYRSDRFVTLSGMLYRMKQNAAGLASICILSTMVIIMVSTTVCLYVGSDDLVKNRYPSEFTMDIINPADGELEAVFDVCNQEAEKMGIKTKNMEITKQMLLLLDNTDQGLQPYYGNVSSEMQSKMVLVTSMETFCIYNKNFSGDLASDEILIYKSNSNGIGDTLSILDETYRVYEKLEKNSFKSKNYLLNIFDSDVIVVANEDILLDMQEKYMHMLENKAGETNAIASEIFSPAEIYSSVCFDTDANMEQQKQLNDNLAEVFNHEIAMRKADKTVENAMSSVMVSCRAEYRETFMAEYGGLLFLGIFLGITFLVATVLIIYYKQIAEGYDDQRRFKIMQQVGMSIEEVQKTIRTQVMLVFFLPLATAGCHIAGAFHMIEKLLNLLNLYNTSLFVVYTLVTVIGFALFYVVVYTLTARVYYRIVNKE